MEEKEVADHNVSSGSSRVSSDQETRITIRDDDHFEDKGDKSGDFEEKSKGLTVIKELNGGSRGKEDNVNQRLCRICHLSRLENEKDALDFIELGCGCRGELGFAHSVCAEAWFKLRGNRLCEICGETAKNVSGTSGSSFMEEWNENGLAAGATALPERRGCWQDQPLCNFLMACLVLAFVLPWFFRVNMF